MPIVVGAQFKPVTKIYFFDPVNHLDLVPKDYVIVDTVKGRDLVQIVQAPHDVAKNEIVGEIKKVIRRATPWDLLQKDLWKEKQTEAVAVCREKARAHKLDIKVRRCEYNYEGGRLTVYFAAEQRLISARLYAIWPALFTPASKCDRLAYATRPSCWTAWVNAAANSVAPVGCASLPR